MSEIRHIQALLEKFWEGETTLEEERQLKGYFASEQVDERLKQYMPLFQAIREEQTVQLNKPKLIPIRPNQYNWQGWAVAASIALLLVASAWWIFSSPAETTIYADSPAEKQLVETGVLPVKPEKQEIARTEKVKTRQFFRSQKRQGKKEKPPGINPEEEAAMEEIKAALALVSSKIRKGRQEAAKGAEHLESIDKIFKKKEG
jgi:hypothetical protein